MGQPLTDSPRSMKRFQPLALAVAGGFAALAVFLPLVPEQFRPWGYAGFGAVALFTAARGGRLGLVAAFALALGAKLAFDLIQYAQKGYDANYLPMPTVYAALGLYAVVGWAMLRRGGNPVRVGAAAVLSSLLFFLVTNFTSWLEQSLPYSRSLTGLLDSYSLALPFWRGTLVSDLMFTAALFGLHAVLSRVNVPTGRLIPIPVEDNRRG
jgi:hypothetical protein